MWHRLQSLDRRVIYICLVVVLLIPMFQPLGLAIQVGEQTQRFYDRYTKFPPGSVVLLSADYSVGAGAELSPQFEVVLKHSFALGYKPIVFALWDQGAPLAQAMAERVAADMGKEYGVDWAYLGFRPGGSIIVQSLSADLWDACINVDGYDQPLADLPLMANVRRVQEPDVAAVVSFSSGTPGDGTWMVYLTNPTGLPLFIGMVAVSVPQRIPVLRSEEVQGMIPGLGGAAEYEVLTKFPGKAAGLMDAQSLVHVAILAFIVLGNVAYLAGKRQRGEAGVK